MPVVGFGKRFERPGGWALLVGALCLALAACGAAGASDASAPPPPGWKDITPPDGGQMANYAVSPDVPGLILATIGGHAQASADPLPAARLWRSTDGGANWQSLDSLNVSSGAQLIMPPGGRGLLFAKNIGDSNISVSQDAGTSWHTLPGNPPPLNTGPVDEWTYLSGAVMVGGRLYAGGVAAGYGRLSAGTTRFSVSDDHGASWGVVETADDPTGADSTTEAIAPLDASGRTWLRLVIVGPSDPDHFPNPVAIERSTDGGVSWQVVTPSLLPGTGLMFAQLASDAAHSGRVCLALSIYDNAPNVTTPPTATPLPSTLPASGSSQANVYGRSMPPPPQKDVTLLASDDGGATWHGGAVLALRRAYGGAITPGVMMSADGSCYLATAQQDGASIPAQQQATLWRLAPGATQPTSIFSLADRSLSSLALAPGGAGTGERLVALTRISGPGDGERISCGEGCYTYRDGGIYRLVWQPLPGA